MHSTLAWIGGTGATAVAHSMSFMTRPIFSFRPKTLTNDEILLTR